MSMSTMDDEYVYLIDDERRNWTVKIVEINSITATIKKRKLIFILACIETHIMY